MKRKIPDEIKEFISYNPETGVFMWVKKRGARGIPGNIIDNATSLGYRSVVFGRKHYFAHRVAWWFVYGVEPECEIDHINGDRTDNRISNLRLASREENTRNASVRKDSKTGVKGVSPDGKSFKARCWADGVRHNLGNFRTIEAAAEAVCKFREENHKEFHNHG